MLGKGRLRRSLLFVPGGSPKMLARARQTTADTVLLDLEDSVAPDQKEHARALVADALRTGPFGDAESAVRINGPGTPYFEADLEAVTKAGAQAIMLPKCEDAAALTRISARLDHIDANRSVRLLALVETAAGIANVHALAEASDRLDALCFGHADFSLDMGLADADPSRGVVYHARCTVAIAAKARGIAPIDNVCLAVKNEAHLREDIALGLGLGFEGKLCIHPLQVTVTNELYTPTVEQIDYAKRVVEGYEAALADGRGVLTIDNKMIDAPLVAQQQRLLERARRAGASQ